MRLARLPQLVGIAVLCMALLQLRVPSTTVAALDQLPDLNETRNGSSAINPISSSSLPDPSHCDCANKAATAMDRFSFASSNSSDAQSSTHDHLHDSAIVQNLLDCQNKTTAISGDDNGALAGEQNDDLVSTGTGMEGSVEEVVRNGKDDDDDDDVAMVKVEKIDSAVPSNTATHTTAGHIPADADQGRRLDDVLVVDKRRLSGRPTPPPSDGGIHTAAQRSAAKSAVQVMDLPKEENMGVVDEPEERLMGRRTPPPGAVPSIHTAAGISVARE